LEGEPDRGGVQRGRHRALHVRSIAVATMLFLLMYLTHFVKNASGERAMDFTLTECRVRSCA